MYDPYARYQPPGPPITLEGDRPPVWGWYVAYTVLMTLMYLGCAGLGLFMASAGVKDEDVITGVLLTAMGLVFGGVYAAAPFLPKKPWAWVYHLVLIIFGLTSTCCLPVALPLMLVWLKPRTKAFFGRI